MKKPKDVEDYLSWFSVETKKKLIEMRKIILEAAPEAEEKISYAMPAYFMGKALVYFAGYKQHIGFYPTSSGIRNFQSEFGDYKYSKGAVQFPLDRPLPKKLIIKIVKLRVKENQQKQKVRKL
jgi:uncharacterized protein YdhG (YjbR/CyaY superfamily)